jgi:hypothetical protein
VDRVDNTKCHIFLEASNVIVFDLCLDLVHSDFDIHCANRVFFFACIGGVSFCPFVLFSSIGYQNTCIMYDYVLVNY